MNSSNIRIWSTRTNLAGCNPSLNLVNSYWTDSDILFKGNTWLLFVAGTDASSSTLDFGIVLMAMYPEIQQEVREEISEINPD